MRELFYFRYSLIPVEAVPKSIRGSSKAYRTIVSNIMVKVTDKIDI